MKITLWIVQILLAAAFLMAGAMKSFTPLDQLAAQMPWVADSPAWVPRLAGISELAGAIGLILPAATRIKPMLTPLAAGGLGLVMLFATIMHLTRGEVVMIVAPLVLFGLSAFVAYARARTIPISPRAARQSTAT